MKQPVIVKGNISKGTKGITVILDPVMPFADLETEIVKKFKELAGFFKKCSMAVSIEGRKLSGEEERRVLELITDHTEIEVLFLMENDPDKEALYVDRVDGASQQRIEEEKAAISKNFILQGTLRSGQTVESENSVVLLGDVNPGGKIMSGGSVIILGALKGEAYAGINGDENAFIIALDMQPTQLRIAGIIVKCAKKPQPATKSRFRKVKEEGPKGGIAIRKGNNIFIENLDHDTLASLSLQ